MNFPKKVKVREVATRDGFQSWPEFVPTEKKVEVISSLIKAGIRDFEATSFVNPKAIPQMADAAQLMAALPKSDSVYAALVPNLKGAQMAAEAGVDQMAAIISASDAHNQANIRRTVEESIAGLDAIFEVAEAKGISVMGGIGVSFGCPYQGDVPPQDVYHIAEAYINRGAALVSLADTTGMATPNRVQSLVAGFKDKFPDTPVILHLHNNRGTAMTNLYAAMQEGVDMFDTALGGIGGCPNVPKAAGNLPTADVVYMLEEMGIDTGVDLNALIKAAHRLEEILGRTLPGQVMKSGPRDPELAEQLCGISHTI